MTLGAFGTGFVLGSFGASFGALYLLQYLYSQRGRPGAAWFMGNIASVAVFCAAYGGGLLVSDPTLRIALEAVAFTALGFMGPFFLAFGLDYTGRGDLIRTPLFAIVGAVPLLTAVLTATNPIHRLVWADFRIDPVFGLATVAYTVQPWGVFALAFSIGTAAVGSLLLIGAILSYGPLYRREATAVILSTAPPTVGVSVWLFGLGPTPQLHLTAPLMLVHVVLDAYAFVGTHMFATSPATITRRQTPRTGPVISARVPSANASRSTSMTQTATKTVRRETAPACAPSVTAQAAGTSRAGPTSVVRVRTAASTVGRRLSVSVTTRRRAATNHSRE